jgi:hypothetical protein
MESQLWKLYHVGGRWPYWQCATPVGPYNFQADDERAAQKIVDRERKQYEESK